MKEYKKLPKIEKNIPAPRNAIPARVVLEKMEIGDSIKVPTKEAGTYYMAARRMGWLTVSRKINETETRIWRLDEYLD